MIHQLFNNENKISTDNSGNSGNSSNSGNSGNSSRKIIAFCIVVEK